MSQLSAALPLCEPQLYPESLLDDYLALARRRRSGTLMVTALRTRSLAARRLLARAVSRSASLEDLLAAAQGMKPRPGAVTPEGIAPGPLADLAGTIALQRILPEDRATGLALYELAVDLHGYQRVPPHHQGIHTRLACQQGRHDRAAELLDRYDGIDPLVRASAALDLANPFVRSAGAAGWLALLGRLLPAPCPRLADDSSLPPFDRLTAPAVPSVQSEVMISVLMTCYRPGQSLITAVRSLIDQSWRNLEILVVDDGSPPEHHAMLARCEALDPRVRVVKLPTNRGTFAARNAAFELAAGQFIAEMDSDDWAHPLRLEQQVRPLLTDSSLQATVPEVMLIGEDLTVTSLGHALSLMGTNSLMYRKDTVLQKLGHYDEVRKAAGLEFLKRMHAAFGDPAILRLGDLPYTLMRHKPGSLSHAEFLPGWKHPARALYKSAYKLWHERIAEGAASPYLAKNQHRRPFAAPRYMLEPPGEETREACDVVFAADWRPYGEAQKSMIEEITALRRRGLKVAILHMESWRHMTILDRPLCRSVQELLNAGEVEQALVSDVLDVELLLVRNPAVLQFCAGERSAIRPRRLSILADEPPAGPDGGERSYVPQACSAIARRMFGVEPQWYPQGPAVRSAIEPRLPALAEP